MIPPRFREQVEALIDPKFYPLEWVEARIADGTIALLENETALLGVEKRIYPGGAVELHAMFAAGDLDGIKDLCATACAAGAADGCDIASVESRPGWQRALKDMDFETDRVRLVKGLR